jgi:hypothetical protein
MKFRCIAAFVCMMLEAFARAEDAAVEFNRDIRPIFSDKCLRAMGPTLRTEKPNCDLTSKMARKLS